MCRNMLSSALGNLTDYLAYIIVALMVIIFIIIVVVAVKKRTKTVGYSSDDIDRSVDEAAKKKAAERAEIEVKKEQPTEEKPTKEPTKSEKAPPPKAEKPSAPAEQPKTEKATEQKTQQATTEKTEKPAEKAKSEAPKAEKTKSASAEKTHKADQPKNEKPNAPKAQKVAPAEVDEEDTGEELTFEADDIDEPEQKEAKGRKISYRILYDKETKTWEVRKDQAKRVIRRVKTKKEALEIAQELCQRQELNLVVHKKDGKFQKQR